MADWALKNIKLLFWLASGLVGVIVVCNTLLSLPTRVETLEKENAAYKAEKIPDRVEKLELDIKQKDRDYARHDKELAELRVELRTMSANIMRILNIIDQRK